MPYVPYGWMFVAPVEAALSVTRPHSRSTWWRESVVRGNGACMGVGCDGVVNSTVTKLLIFLVVNNGAAEGESCADALSASHVGR